MEFLEAQSALTIGAMFGELLTKDQVREAIKKDEPVYFDDSSLWEELDL